MNKGLRIAAGIASLSWLAACNTAPEKPPLTKEQADLMLLQASGPQEVQNRKDQLKQQMQDATDNLFASALDAGQAVVVMPTINLDSEGFNFISYRDISRFATMSSGVTEWVNSTHPKEVFRTGPSQSLFRVGPSGAFYEALSGRRRYQIYVVTPGHYDLLGIRYSMPKARMPSRTGLPQSSHHIGMVTLRDAMFRLEEPDDHRNLKNSAKFVSDTYCTPAKISRGDCGIWEQAPSDAGKKRRIYQVHPTTPFAGLGMQVRFAAPFASFDIKPGEVVLMDGFYPEDPSTVYNDTDCQRVGVDKMQCGARNASLVRIFSSLEDFRSVGDPAKSGATKLSAILQKLQERTIKVHARKIVRNSVWGQTYRIGR